MTRDPILYVTAAILLISGCATTDSKKIVGPDGTENQLISCFQIENCYQKASEVCSGKYKIVNTNSETSGVNGVTDTTVKLLVKCGG